MAILFAGWAFVSFLFYRIFTAASFDDPLTIIASAICGLVTALIFTFAAGSYAFAIGKASARNRLRGERHNVIGVTIWPFLIASVCNVIQGYLVALGFSEKLFNDISRSVYYREFYQQDYFWFVVMMIIPVLAHYFLTLMGASVDGGLEKLDE